MIINVVIIVLLLLCLLWPKKWTCSFVWVLTTQSLILRILFTFSNTNLDPRHRLKLLKRLRTLSLLRLEHVDFARVFQRLSPVAEPHSNHFPVIVQLSGNFCNFLACGQSVLLEVGVQNLNRLRGEAGAPLAFFGRLAAHKLHQVLLALLVPVFGFSQPLLQHRLQLLSALGGDVQLLKPATWNTLAGSSFSEVNL